MGCTLTRFCSIKMRLANSDIMVGEVPPFSSASFMLRAHICPRKSSLGNIVFLSTSQNVMLLIGNEGVVHVEEGKP